MGKLFLVLLLLLVASHALVATRHGGHEYERQGRGEFDEGGDMEEGSRSGGHGGASEEVVRRGKEVFILHDSLHLVKTEAGQLRIVKGVGRQIRQSPMHIGFVTMEPNSLFIPQYLDCSIVIFIRSGEARVGHIYRENLVEQQLKSGDVYRIEAGSAFYIVNTAENQRLHIISSIDTSESLRVGWHGLQSFYVGGGSYPTSVLSGFPPSTLSTAFNVSTQQLKEMTTTQQSGPIVYMSGSKRSGTPNVWSKFMELEEHERLDHLRTVVQQEEETAEDEEEPSTWSLRKLLISILDNRQEDKANKGPQVANIYSRKPNYKNNYGWTKALTESDYHPLGQSNVGIYLVNLTAGSMLAPHVNPTATEYGIVLRGSGTIQIVLPNGTLALNANVREGDVFWVPRYFPFCQIASGSGPFEIFGFTTSSRKNHPQFLVGANSLLHTLKGPEIATAFGVNEERFKEIINAQHEGVILPSSNSAPPEVTKKQMQDNAEMKIPEFVKNFGTEMIMGFD